MDFENLQEKFISAFGLDNIIKSDLKFFIKGKEISDEDEIMDIIKEDDIIEVKNLKEEEEFLLLKNVKKTIRASKKL